MNENDQDKAEVSEAAKVLHQAEVNSVKTDAAIASIHRITMDVQTIVDRNGYVARFRELLRGA